MNRLSVGFGVGPTGGFILTHQIICDGTNAAIARTATPA
jgi:hypothetical protein